MRKVKIKNWIPRINTTHPDNRAFIVAQTGTGCFETEFSTDGLFHQWAPAYEEFENGAGNYTVALVELANGTIEQVLPKNLKFITE